MMYSCIQSSVFELTFGVPSEFGLGFIFRHNDPRSSYTFGVWPVEFGPSECPCVSFFLRNSEKRADQYPNKSFTVLKKNKSDRV